jgi:hypothetical protein
MWFLSCTKAACFTSTCRPASSTISIKHMEKPALWHKYRHWQQPRRGKWLFP